MGRSAVLALALVLALGILAGEQGAEAAADPTAVSWSVSPSDGQAADGRSSIQHAVDPGGQVTDNILVRNLGAEDVTFRLAAADGYYTSSGRFDMLPSDRESVDAGTWVSLPEEVLVPAGSAVNVPFVVTVPNNAEPGDHALGIAASILSMNDGEGTGVGVESRVGVKVITRVTGEILPSFAVADVEVDYRQMWNPFEPGDLTVSFIVENTGNTRMAAAGVLEIAGQSIPFPAPGSAPQQLLPDEERSFSLDVHEVWPLFAAAGELRVDPMATLLDESPSELEGQRISLFVFTVPWPQLGLVAGVLLLVLAFFWKGRRSRRKVEALVAEAFQRGREQPETSA